LLGTTPELDDDDNTSIAESSSSTSAGTTFGVSQSMELVANSTTTNTASDPVIDPLNAKVSGPNNCTTQEGQFDIVATVIIIIIVLLIFIIMHIYCLYC